MTELGAFDAAGGPVEQEAQPSVPECVELREGRRQLRVRWPDGLEAPLSAATLRNACRCAACTHSRRNGSTTQADARIALDQVAEFGVAGLHLVFSDGHRRGIFPWAYLRQLACGAD
jgi:DUF971 family protein